MQIFKTPNFNFVRWRWHAIALSLFIVLAGAAMVYRNNGLPLGVEFEGGSVDLEVGAQGVLHPILDVAHADAE